MNVPLEKAFEYFCGIDSYDSRLACLDAWFWSLSEFENALDVGTLLGEYHFHFSSISDRRASIPSLTVGACKSQFFGYDRS
jgi:hypothetical protein